jgi:RNA polymerase sigma-70 factor, ECF subfamily
VAQLGSAVERPGFGSLGDLTLTPVLAGLDEELCANYRRLFSELVRYLARRTGDEELAEDIAQETFLRAISTCEDFDWRRPMWPWLKVTATRLLINHLRKSDREVVGDLDDDVSFDSPLALEDEMLLAEAIACVPRRQRLALSLTYVEGWSTSEAASFMGVTKPAFKQLLTRARGRLRIEYGRLSRGVAALLPVRFMRKVWERGMRAGGYNDTSRGLTLVGADRASHVLAGLLALVVATSPSANGVDPGSGGSTMHFPGVVDEVKREPLKQMLAGDNSFGSTSTVSGGSDGGSLPAPTGVPPDPVEDLTEPNKDVKQPEDATLTSIVLAPDEREGRTAFATGVTHCRVQPCPPVLFRTADGGATWKRLRARGLTGVKIAIPPGFGSHHRKIFAMGAAGLQLSSDGGRTFRLAPAAGTPLLKGSIAVSPAFMEDPMVLIGSQSLMRYDDIGGQVEPYLTTALRGPFEPTFPPDYPADDRILLGGLTPTLGGFETAVFVCSAQLCHTIPIMGDGAPPKLLPAPSFSDTGRLYAFTDGGLYRRESTNSGIVSLETPWRGVLADVSLIDEGRGLLAATLPLRHTADDAFPGLFRSRDEGTTWERISHPLLNSGVSSVALGGERIIVTLPDRGLACSSDQGRSWDRRCG